MLHAFIRGFLTDKRANTAIMFALSLPILIGCVGLGVETGYWYFKQRELQTAADVAAIAGAVEKRAGKNYATIKSSAQAEAVEQGWVAGAITVNNPPTSGTNQVSSAVEVILTMPEPRFFSQIFSSSTVTAYARGVAKGNSGGDACILALDQAAAGAVTFTGNALAFINGCNVMSNSLNASALVVNGSADVTVPCAMAAGGLSVDDGLHLSSCTEPQQYQPQATDPFANLAVPPTPGGPCDSLPGGPGGSPDIYPGHFCGGGPLKGTRVFHPGVYIIDGFDFRINSGANVSGSGVTFYLTNNATIDFNGNADINLSAPTSGTYAGILVYGSHNNGYNSSKFNGTATSKLTGAIYMPKQDVEFLGNFSGQNGCMRVIAATIKFTGSTTLSANCSAYGISQIPLPGTVSLVE